MSTQKVNKSIHKKELTNATKKQTYTNDTQTNRHKRQINSKQTNKQTNSTHKPQRRSPSMAGPAAQSYLISETDLCYV